MDSMTNKTDIMQEINSDIENNVKKIKERAKKKTFQKKWKMIKTTYLLTYKSLPIKKIFLFWLSVILGLIFLFLALNTLSKNFLISIPTYGGTLTEGIVGVPRYINPVLATNDSEKDLTSLIFSGLLKKNEFGELINDLAEEVMESEDKLSYTISINEKATFHDGKKLTSEDIIFTVNKIQDKRINSPLAINFEGVEIEKIDETTLVFHLKKPFYYFKEALTFGILPKHLLENLTTEEFVLSDFNTKPIGSGPFKIDSVIKNNNIAEKYSLVSNRKYVGGRPYLDKININIYQNTVDILSAFNSGKIETTASLSHEDLEKVNKKTIIIKNLPVIYFISYNSNKNKLLADKEIRAYLSKAINKQEMIDEILKGHANKKDFFFGNSLATNELELKDVDSLREKEINLTTINIGNLKEIAEKIANYWREKGLIVNVIIYNISDISEVIKNRNFEILLFGSILAHDTDLFAYWHSSQRTYPGLNITGYASNALDKNLDDLKKSYDQLERTNLLEEINKELITEMPALPLYSQNMNYIVSDKTLAKLIENKIPNYLLEKNDRFINVNEWFKYKENVWSFSYNKKIMEKLENIIH